MRLTPFNSPIDLLSTDNQFVSANTSKTNEKQLAFHSHLGSTAERFERAHVVENTPKPSICYEFDEFWSIWRWRVQRSQWNYKIPMEHRRKSCSKIEATRVGAKFECRITRSEKELMWCDQRDVLASVTGYRDQWSITVQLGGLTTKNATRVDLKPDFQVNLFRE